MTGLRQTGAEPALYPPRISQKSSVSQNPGLVGFEPSTTHHVRPHGCPAHGSPFTPGINWQPTGGGLDVSEQTSVVPPLENVVPPVAEDPPIVRVDVPPVAVAVPPVADERCEAPPAALEVPPSGVEPPMDGVGRAVVPPSVCCVSGRPPTASPPSPPDPPLSSGMAPSESDPFCVESDAPHPSNTSDRSTT